MSATIATPAATDVRALDAELNRMIGEGRILDAFERFYADDVVMQENREPATRGKGANREREAQFVSSVEAFHGLRWLRTAVDGNASFAEYEMDVSLKGVGRITLAQTAVREWSGGEIVAERFYHA